MKKKNLLMLSALFLTATTVPGEAGAADTYLATNWCNPNSSWLLVCWTDGVPADGDNAYIHGIYGGYTVTYGANLNTHLGTLDVGGIVPTDNSVTLKITDPANGIGATILSANVIYVGSGAVLSQEGGEVYAGWPPPANNPDVFRGLIIGKTADTAGIYNLTGGTLATNQTIISSGTFTQDGATGSMVNTTHQTDSLTLGLNYGSHGVYNLGVGTLTSNSLVVGDRGTGEFTQSAPLNSYNSTGSLVVAKEDSAVGTYTMQGGWLFAGSEIIGRDGIGSFTHWGGLNDVTGDLTVGYLRAGIGTYAMNGMFGGNPELRAVNVFVGKSGTGSFDQFGGTNTVAGNLIVGHGISGSGTYILDGWGALSVAGNEVIGNEGTGALTQFGGVNTVGGQLNLGLAATGSGILTLDSWGEIHAADIQIGVAGTGSFSQVQGQVTASSLVIGRDAGSNGTYNLNMGQLRAAHITVGMDGTGVFNQTTDGQNMYFDNGSLSIGSGSGNGTYNMSGGMLVTTSINIGTGSGTGTFNHTGANVSADQTLTIGANGTYNMSDDGSSWFGPRLYANTIVNNGTMNFNGGEIQTAGGMCSYCGEGPFPTNILNNGTFNVGGAGERQISGVFVNNGTMKITDTTVRFNREFTNNGAYISDPSTNIFSSLTVGANGYLAGGAGDNFQIWNDFFSYSTRDDLWNTADATLSFHGWQTHEFYLGGWDAASSRRFSWGTLELSGYGDLFFSGGPGAALYVDNLILGSGTTLNLNGFDLYYTTLTDNGGSFYGGQLIHIAGNTGGGSISAVPEPSMLLLFGSGFAGLFGMRGFRRYLGNNAQA